MQSTCEVEFECSELHLLVRFAEACKIVIIGELQLSIVDAIGSSRQERVPSVHLLLLQKTLRGQIHVAVVEVKTISRASIDSAMGKHSCSVRTQTRTQQVTDRCLLLNRIT